MKKLSLKLFIIFSFTFLLFILSNSNVYASVNVDFNGSSYVLPDLPDFPSNGIYIFRLAYADNIELIFFPKIDCFIQNRQNENDFIILVPNDITVLRWVTRKSNSYKSWEEGTSVSSFYTLNSTVYPDYAGRTYFSSYAKAYMMYSSVDIVLDDTNETVFQVAPAVTGQIATKITSVDFSMVLLEVLGLLPMILVIVIGLIALMKAIKLLFSIFQNA